MANVLNTNLHMQKNKTKNKYHLYNQNLIDYAGGDDSIN